MTDDKIGAAIAAAEAQRKAQAFQEQLANLETWQLILNGSGRPTIVATPPDMTEGEIIDLIAWASVQLSAIMAERRPAPGGKVIEIVQSLEGMKPS